MPTTKGAQSILGRDPVASGQLSREEISKGESDPNYRLKLAETKVHLPEAKRKKGPRYTPVSRRQDRPNAILWLVRNHPELKDSQIMRLVGTTKSTIDAIRDRTHWNATNLAPMDPVTLGLCSQIDLDFEVHRAAKEKPAEPDSGATLLPAEVTTARPARRSRGGGRRGGRAQGARRAGRVRQAQANRRQDRIRVVARRGLKIRYAVAAHPCAATGPLTFVRVCDGSSPNARR